MGKRGGGCLAGDHPPLQSLAARGGARWGRAEAARRDRAAENLLRELMVPPPPPSSYQVDTPRPSPRTNRTRRVPHLVGAAHER